MSKALRPDATVSLSRRALIGGAAALAGMAVLSRHAGAQTLEPVGDIAFSDRITRLLSASPARSLSEATPIPFSYADLAGQLEAAGVERPDPSSPGSAYPAGFPEATMALPLASRPFQTGLDPEWADTFGFNPLAIGQSLDFFTPPNVVSIFAGGFDAERVDRALEASGYQMVLQETGGPYWSLGDELQLDTPAGRLGAGQMNHALVTEDLLVFTQREEDVQAVSQALGGYVEAMAEQELWSGMVSLFPSDTVGLMPVAPQSLFGEAATASPIASPVPQGPSASIEYIVFGIRAGSRSAPIALVGEGTPEPTPVGAADPVPARVEVRIRYGSEEMAAREADAIPVRWDETSSAFTGQPYSELMQVEGASVAEQHAHVVAVSFVTDAPNRWSQMLLARDLAPFIPPPPVG